MERLAVQGIAAGQGMAAVLLLSDGRFPAGGHAHSGGLEAAVTSHAVYDLGTLKLFLRGRLRTAGVVTGALAAVACRFAHESRTGAGLGADWTLLDAETDARTPSPAQRAASRRQGRALLRAARAAWPGAPELDGVAGRGSGVAGEGVRAAPHHCLVLGAAAAAAGCGPAQAALIAAYQSVSGPASAAVRLLALDPLQVSGLLARLAADIDQAGELGEAAAGQPLDELAYATAPALDLLAEAHTRREMTLFAS
jgi:urease accessory protein